MTMAFSFFSARLLGFAMNFGRAILIAVFAVLFVSVLLPDVRTSIRGAILRDYRMIISTVHGDLTGNGQELTVAKIRTRESIFLEIYQPQEDGSQKLMGRIALPDKKDGFFNFNGQATNLAIDDIDGDGLKEILVPTFDQNMVGHLHVYRYDAGSGSFQKSTL